MFRNFQFNNSTLRTVYCKLCSSVIRIRCQIINCHRNLMIGSNPRRRTLSVHMYLRSSSIIVIKHFIHQNYNNILRIALKIFTWLCPIFFTWKAILNLLPACAQHSLRRKKKIIVRNCLLLYKIDDIQMVIIHLLLIHYYVLRVYINIINYVKLYGFISIALCLNNTFFSFAFLCILI